MIAPHALLKLDAANVRRDRASLAAIQPAIGPPGQRVGHRVGVFHAKAREQHFGIAVGHVVAIAIGVEQQIGHLQHEHAAVAKRQSAGQVQTGDEILRPIRPAVAVGVFQDRDAVGALRPARRRLGHAIVGGARVAIDLRPFQPGRIGILQILNDPQPARHRRTRWPPAAAPSARPPPAGPRNHPAPSSAAPLPPPENPAPAPSRKRTAQWPARWVAQTTCGGRPPTPCSPTGGTRTSSLLQGQRAFHKHAHRSQTSWADNRLSVHPHARKPDTFRHKTRTLPGRVPDAYDMNMPLELFHPLVADWFARPLLRPDRTAIARLARNRRRPQYADRGAHRLGQDPGSLSGLPRPTGAALARRHARRQDLRGLRLAAEGPGQRHPPQPGSAAG